MNTRDRLDRSSGAPRGLLGRTPTLILSLFLLLAAWVTTSGAQVPPDATAPNGAVVIPVQATNDVFEAYVEVTWPASGAPNTFYRIKRGTQLLSVVAGGVSSYRDYGGVPDTTYTYCVAEINVATGDTVDVGCDTGRRKINAPTSMSATDNVYQASVVVTWTDNSTIETGYRLYRDGTPLILLAANSEGYVDNGATPGATYNYCVRAVDSLGRMSAQACDNGSRAFIQAPGAVAATDGQDPARVLVTWTDKTDLEVGYVVRRRVLPAGVPAVLDTTNVNAVEYADSTAVLGTLYEYCVAAVDTSGNLSAWICDGGNRGALPPPANVQASDSVFDDRVRVTWQDQSDTEDGFLIFRHTVAMTDTTFLGTVGANVTEVDDVDGQPGVNYVYCVRAFTNLGARSAAGCNQGRRAVILAPTNVQASDGTYEDLVEITWESSATAVVLYKLYRNNVAFTTVPGNATSAFDTTGVPGTTYTYAVSAVTAFEDESLKGTNTGFRTLKAPTNVEAGDFNNEVHVLVSWTDNSQHETGYRIFRKLGAGSPTLIGTRPANRTAYLDSTGTPGATYEYSVLAYDPRGTSTSDADNGGRLIPPPTDVRATDGDFETRIVVEWVDNARFETGYRVYRRLVGATDSTLVATLGANVDEYNDTTILFGRNYEYIVKAYDAYGTSLPDRDTGFTVIQPPTSVLASDSYSDSVRVTWVDASVIEDGYVVYRNGVPMDTLGANVSYWADGSGTIDLDYTYCVKAFDLASAVHTYSAETCDIGRRATAAVVSLARTKLLTEKLMASGLASSDGFGTWVDVDGDYAAIGAPHDVVNTTSEGKVYIFHWTGTEWEESQVLRASVNAPHPLLLTPGNEFGAALAMDGTRLIVGAPNTDWNQLAPLNYFGGGAAYVFERDSQGQYSIIEYLSDPSPGHGARYGSAVDMKGSYLVVGSGNKNNASGAEGAFWVYSETSADNWAADGTYGTIDVDRLVTSGDAGGDFLGWSVSVTESGDFYAGFRDAAPGFTGGFAFFKRSSTNSVFLDVVRLSGNPGSTGLGTAIEAVGSTAVVGAPLVGKAYVFNRTGNFPSMSQELTASDGGAGFGRSVAYDGTRIIVGAQNAYYLFEKDAVTGLWSETLKYLLDGNGTLGYYKPGIDGNNLVLGAPTNGTAGAAFFDQILVGPSNLTASDAEFDKRIQVRWKDNSTTEDGYRLYRDGVLLEELSANSTSYSDTDVQPGRIYEYCIESFNAITTSLRACDYGWIPPDGNITGRVATRNGTAVDGVEVCLDPSPIKALLFDGSQGAVKAATTNVPALTEFTLEYWARSSDTRAGAAFSYATAASTTAIVSRSLVAPVLQIGASTVTAPTINKNDNMWHHVAWTWRSSDGAVRLYVDGVEAASGTLATGTTISAEGFTVLGQEQASFGGGFTTPKAFRGQLDEVRLWSVARSQAAIAADRTKRLAGSEENLALYWPMDEGMNLVVADQTANATYGQLMAGVGWSDDSAPLVVCGVTDAEGNYVLDDIRYGAGTTFRVTPMFSSRQFEPAFKTITLNGNSPVQNEVAFTDISSYSVSGFVQFKGTDIESQAYTCPVNEIEIYVDGVLRGTTGPDGKYSFPVDIGPHEIEARYAGHSFSPAKRTIFADRDLANLNFEDLAKFTLSGIAAGGCDLSIGDVTYEVRTENSCFVIEDDADGPYSQLLPAQKYSVRVVDIDLPIGSPLDRADILKFFENVGPKTVDLTRGNATLDFIYRAPLVIVVEGFAAPGCTGLLVPGSMTPLPAVPIIEQGESVPLVIQVFEDYGAAGLCPVDSGLVTVFDEIIDEGDTPVPLDIMSGEATYTTIANTPNVFAGRRDANGNDRSYQKPISFVAEVEGQDPITLTKWVVVTGQRPRIATFTSVSEEIPLMILRDPPGDASNTFLEEGTTICNTISDMFLEKFETGVQAKIKGGLRFSKGTPFWSTDTELAQETENNFIIGFEATQDDGVQICATTTERISTSDSDQFVDNRGDVFMGVALNLIFAKSDVVEVTTAGGNCTIQKSEAITMGGDGFETTYLYTAEHLRSVLIPQNLELAELTGDVQFATAAENWQNHLDLNDSLKAAATFVKNRSFSAGADFEYTAVSDTTESFAWTTKVYTTNELALGFIFDESGSGTEFKAVVNLGFEYTRSEAETEQRTRTIGYKLSDDDIYDFFTVDIKDDPFYGTPVFDVLSGRSSCPWEPWRSPTTGEPRTQPRDGAVLSIEPPVQLDVDPDGVAEFVLTMTNDSPADETREYFLMPNQVKNTGGASIFVGGDTFIQLPFFLLPGQSTSVSLTIARGPTQYLYEDIELLLISTCEFDYWRATGFAQLADTVRFTVGFKAPCSDITLFEPKPDWGFNAQDAIDDNNLLRLTLDDFELAVGDDDSLLSIGAEYRRVGTEDWFPIAEVPRSNILLNANGTPRSNEIFWNVANVVDGSYELRAFTRCEGGRAFSGSATGTIDRKAPLVLGNPQPADSVLSLGEEIAITFNERIDCESVNASTVVVNRVKPDGTLEPIQFSLACADDRFVVTPTNPSLPLLEGKKLRVRVEGVTDRFGNPMVGPGNQAYVQWGFDIRQQVFTWSQFSVSKTVPYLSPGSVVAELVNGSGQALTFDLVDVPAYLSASPANGTIDPAEKLNIDFDIQDNLAIGAYDAVVTAVALNGPDTAFVAPLSIHIDVVCVAPNWTVNPADFEQSMTLVARTSIGGQPATTKDLVAAFVGNELRGVAKPLIVPGRTDSLLYITIYSNRTSGETVRFQFFDQSACLPYNSATKTYPFVADSRVGTPLAPEVFAAATVAPGSPQFVAVNEGWTWISFNRLSLIDMSVNGVLGDLNSENGDLLKSQAAFSQFDETNGWVGNLSVFDNIKGYMIHMAEAGTITLEGLPVTPATTTIPVVSGWNWIGYTPDGPLETNLALADISPTNGDVIKGQHGFAQFVKSGSTNRWFGSLASMEPGKGYKLYLTNASNTQNAFEYPNVLPLTAGVDRANPQLTVGGAGVASHGWNVRPNDFQFNMTITGTVDLGGASFAAGDAVAAFVGDELRGSTTFVDIPGRERPVFFLMAHGNVPDGETLRFEYYSAARDETYLVDGTLAFEADRVVGDVSAPWSGVVGALVDDTPAGSLVPRAFQLAQNVPNPPNPMNPLTTIRFALPTKEHVRLRMYDVAGREVLTLVDAETPAGWHDVTLDGRMLSSGLYFYRLEAGTFSQTQKMLIVK
jgi:hypothetical protein